MEDFSLCLPEISRQELSLLLDGTLILTVRNYRFLFYVFNNYTGSSILLDRNM